MDLTSIDKGIGVLIGLFTLAGLAWGFRAKAWPRWKAFRSKVGGIFDALAGRDEVIDSITGEVIKDAVPALGVRMAHQEKAMELQGQQMELLAVTVTKLVDQQAHQMKLEKRVDDHDSRIKQLEDGTIERIAAKAEAVSAWRAVEAVAKHTDPLSPESGDEPEIEQ